MSASDLNAAFADPLCATFARAVQVYVAGCFFEDKVLQSRAIDHYRNTAVALDYLGGEGRKVLARFLDGPDDDLRVIAAIELARVMPDRARATLRDIVENSHCRLGVMAQTHDSFWEELHGTGGNSVDSPKP